MTMNDHSLSPNYCPKLYVTRGMLRRNLPHCHCVCHHLFRHITRQRWLTWGQAAGLGGGYDLQSVSLSGGAVMSATASGRHFNDAARFNHWQHNACALVTQSRLLSHKRNKNSNGIHVLSIYFWPRVYIHCMFTIRVRVRLSVRVRARDSFKLIMNFACATKHLIGLLPLDVL